MIKQAAVYLYGEIPWGTKKERDWCVRLDYAQMHYSKWKKPDSKGYYWMIQLTWRSGKDKIVRLENKSSATKGWLERLATKRSKGIFFVWWTSSRSWLWWGLHYCIDLSKLRKLYKVRGNCAPYKLYQNKAYLISSNVWVYFYIGPLVTSLHYKPVIWFKEWRN